MRKSPEMLLSYSLVCTLRIFYFLSVSSGFSGSAADIFALLWIHAGTFLLYCTRPVNKFRVYAFCYPDLLAPSRSPFWKVFCEPCASRMVHRTLSNSGAAPPRQG